MDFSSFLVVCSGGPVEDSDGVVVINPRLVVQVSIFHVSHSSVPKVKNLFIARFTSTINAQLHDENRVHSDQFAWEHYCYYCQKLICYR